ncbi:expressed unknown protein [Seminavis robusta]|uniref:Helicase-associated domain-containing protein n=1 Tax=Seminavis robusta TaxID=568900 RepID=A0A9N8H8J7_9STRA|nr:expressed unknown protein [Seminavis robusta]|eukprot:Sro162_g072840.1 n/a (923) ;mRNA; f:42928-45852
MSDMDVEMTEAKDLAAVSDDDQPANDDVKMVDTSSDTEAPNQEIVDFEKLHALLGPIKSAGDLIQGKHVMLLIGLTGAGKTTTTLYLAGATFEEEDVDGYSHYKPKELPNPDLLQFAVSGGATSVTKSIHATTIELEGEDGAKQPITICDTPGFGDTKGPEMEIANNLGIIHALKRAASIKVVVVLDHRTMDGARWQPLRQNLSTVVAMMGRDKPIDFSTFGYVFTRCEGRSKKRIHKQLAGFQKTLRKDPAGILGGNVGDKDILDAMLTDMISKTQPGDAICIDPEESDDAADTLKSLWSGGRLENPAEAFVNFCSKQSMAALMLQFKATVDTLENSLRDVDLKTAEVFLHQMTRMAEALSLSAVDEAVEQGTQRVKSFVEQLQSEIESLTQQMAAQGIPLAEFERVARAIPPKLTLMQQTRELCNVSGLAFDCNSILAPTLDKLFSIARNPIKEIRANPTDVIPNQDVLQGAILRLSCLVANFHGLAGRERIQNECSTLTESVSDMIKPVLTLATSALVEEPPTSDALNGSIDELVFLLGMKEFLDANKTSFLDQEETTPIRWLSAGLDDLSESLSKQSVDCVSQLSQVHSALQELLQDTDSWSCASLLVLKEAAEYCESRAFLLALSSSSRVSTMVPEDDDEPKHDAKHVVKRFDEKVIKYLSKVAEFVQCGSKQLIDDNAKDAATRLKEAKELVVFAATVGNSCEKLAELDASLIREVEKELFGAQKELKLFIEESKKSPGHGIRRPKLLEPTSQELARATSAMAKKGLKSWYEKCKDLRAYKIKHGHCNVPTKHPRLGIWVQQQRVEKKKYERGLKTSMTDEKLEHLSALEFKWQVKADHGDAWNCQFEALKKFKEEHGHCRVPWKTPKLGKWVSDQRSQYRAMCAGRSEWNGGRPITMKNEQVAKLKAIGALDGVA